MSTQMERIYRDDKRIADFKVGFRHGLKCAAELADSWEGQHDARKYRLSDIILRKFGMARRLRKAKKARQSK